jgi:hypothetical protein
MVYTLIALPILMASLGFSVDIGQIVLAAQRCQTIADAGALAGSQEMPNTSAATAMATAISNANVPASQSGDYSVSTTSYTYGSTLPGGSTAPLGGALRITAAKQVSYIFLRVLGFRNITVRRSALATKIVTGTCIAALWIDNATPVSFGVQMNMLMASSPCYPGIPGSFGFLHPNGGVDFNACLKGLITPDQEDLQRENTGDYVWAETGLKTGQFKQDLKSDADSRLARGTSGVYASDTFTSYHADNPRIMIIPLVDYVDGTGSGARFIVRRFGAFWLEDVVNSTSDKKIVGRFIDFTQPGGTGAGIKTTHLVG